MGKNVPFKVRTADGKTVSVPHPDFAAISPSGRFLYVYYDDDSSETLDVFLISAVEVGPAPQKADA